MVPISNNIVCFSQKSMVAMPVSDVTPASPALFAHIIKLALWPLKEQGARG
jgi:hypothetical protein